MNSISRANHIGRFFRSEILYLGTMVEWSRVTQNVEPVNDANEFANLRERSRYR
jgi:hypothetical protein